jgi:hypothetical protein
MLYKIIFAFSFLLCSCSYSVYSSGYPHLKSISIIPFVNHTTEYDLDDALLVDLSENFERDGRLNIVGLSPDSQLEGEILDYSNKIHSYGDTEIDEYEVKILFKIVFYDLVKNRIIYQNDSLLLKEVYSPTNENNEFSSEEEAKNEIYNDLFDTIVKLSLEEW